MRPRNCSRLDFGIDTNSAGSSYIERDETDFDDPKRKKERKTQRAAWELRGRGEIQGLQGFLHLAFNACSRLLKQLRTAWARFLGARGLHVLNVAL